MSEELNSPGYEIPPEMQGAVAITTLDKIYNWGRRSSIWPMMFGLACCAIEMICTAASRYDFSRFGMEVMRPSPRQADLMIVSGTVTKKMVPQIVRLYNQMPEPKYVVAMGACASGGGPFKEGYNVVSGVDKYRPGGCLRPRLPAHPAGAAARPDHPAEEDRYTVASSRCAGTRRKAPTVIPVPVLGPGCDGPAQYDQIKQYTTEKLAQRTGCQPGTCQRDGVMRREP